MYKISQEKRQVHSFLKLQLEQELALGSRASFRSQSQLQSQSQNVTNTGPKQIVLDMQHWSLVLDWFSLTISTYE
jgi:hypothetical protein